MFYVFFFQFFFVLFINVLTSKFDLTLWCLSLNQSYFLCLEHMCYDPSEVYNDLHLRATVMALLISGSVWLMIESAAVGISHHHINGVYL